MILLQASCFPLSNRKLYSAICIPLRVWKCSGNTLTTLMRVPWVRKRPCGPRRRPETSGGQSHSWRSGHSEVLSRSQSPQCAGRLNEVVGQTDPLLKYIKNLINELYWSFLYIFEHRELLMNISLLNLLIGDEANHEMPKLYSTYILYCTIQLKTEEWIVHH